MSFAHTLSSVFPKSENEIPEKYRLEPLHQTQYLVNGQLVNWDGRKQEVYSPVCMGQEDGQPKRMLIGSYPLVGETEALQALDAALQAYDSGRGQWPTMAVNERIACLEQFTKAMATKKAEVVKLLMWEIGKSAKDSEKEFDRTIEYIYDTIEAVKELDREASRFQIESGIIAQIRRAPLGVVLCMGPFNYPLNETFATLIPALIMGNTILFKPPKHGALLHFPLLQAFAQCFPKGVVNTVYGRGNEVVPALMTSGKIDVLALIGSSRVADQLKKQHPKSNRLRAILGLDAKNMAVVLPDADLENAKKEVLLGALSFNGQRCTALKVIFVHRRIAHQFVKDLSAAVDQLKPGLPWTEGVQITPLPEPGKPGYLADVIKDAQEKGAELTNELGGKAEGPMVYPTVLYPVNETMRIYREEQFGPVIPVVPFDDVEEPISYLINSDHGQQVSLFGSNPDKLSALIDPLVNQVCRVNINAQCQRGPDVFPFTGRKDSAEGTLSVTDALRSFSIRTMVATKYDEANKQILNSIVDQHKSHFLSTRYIL